MSEEKKQNLTEEEALSSTEAVPESGAEPEAAGTGTEPAEENARPTPEEELEAAREEAKGNYERYVRSVAELENFRRRSLREKEEARKYAAASLVQDLLPVLDNFVLGLESARNHPEAAGISQGFEMVYQQTKSILKEHGVEEIDPAGQAFDPHRHESTGSEPHDEVPEGHVTRVVRRGYALNDRLLRPAMVVLSAGPAGAEIAEDAASGDQTPRDDNTEEK